MEGYVYIDPPGIADGAVKKWLQLGDANKAGTLKCIAGVPYEVTKHDGITSYTNFPGATCES